MTVSRRLQFYVKLKTCIIKKKLSGLGLKDIRDGKQFSELRNHKDLMDGYERVHTAVKNHCLLFTVPDT